MAAKDDDRPTGATGERADEAPDQRATTNGDTAGPTAEAERERDAQEQRAVPFTQQLGRVLVAVILILFGIFAVTNSQPVAFDWIFGETQVRQIGDQVRGGVPLILLLLGSFVLGALAGWFATWRRGRRG